MRRASGAIAVLLCITLQAVAVGCREEATAPEPTMRRGAAIEDPFPITLYDELVHQFRAGGATPHRVGEAKILAARAPRIGVPVPPRCPAGPFRFKDLGCNRGICAEAFENTCGDLYFYITDTVNGEGHWIGPHGCIGCSPWG